MLLIVCSVSAVIPDIPQWVDGVSDLSPTDPTQIRIYLESAPNGIRSYVIKFAAPPGVDVVGIELPEWIGGIGMTRNDIDEISIQGIDIDEKMQQGEQYIELAKVSVERNCLGAPVCPRPDKAVMVASAWYFDDDNAPHMVGVEE